MVRMALFAVKCVVDFDVDVVGCLCDDSVVDVTLVDVGVVCLLRC